MRYPRTLYPAALAILNVTAGWVLLRAVESPLGIGLLVLGPLVGLGMVSSPAADATDQQNARS